MAVTSNRSDLSRLDFSKGDGLLPAIIQHADTGAVLMLGYMNAEALELTQTRGRVVFYSRSRQTLWEKGETSGHSLNVEAIRTDCDADTLLITARPLGPTCHEGSATCFGDELLTGAARLGFLAQLARIIEQRASAPPEESYTAKLIAAGPARMAQKVGEEGVEVALAAVTQGDDKLLSESADLLFHLMVLFESRKLSLEQVVSVLASRHAAVRAAADT
jgi:phosphoribosyl-ATP pyrophosphohydrolase/phosphoribosyl-AMP cyclohydrolase